MLAASSTEEDSEDVDDVALAASSMEEVSEEEDVDVVVFASVGCTEGIEVGSGGRVGRAAGHAPPARSAGLVARLQISETTLQQWKIPGAMAVETAAS